MFHIKNAPVSNKDPRGGAIFAQHDIILTSRHNDKLHGYCIREGTHKNSPQHYCLYLLINYKVARGHPRNDDACIRSTYL